MPTVSTRLIRLDDADAIAALLRANRRFFAWTTPVRRAAEFTTDGQHAEIDQALRDHGKGAVVPHVIVDGDRVMGRIGLTHIKRSGLQSATVGYVLNEADTGRGFAKEALGLMRGIAFGQLGLHRIDATTLTTNIASQRVLERNGFTRLCTLPKYVQIANAWRDAYLYQTLSDD